MYYNKICQVKGCQNECYKYSVLKEYKRHTIINFLLNEILVDIINNKSIDNEIINIKLLENIQNKNINFIFKILNTEFENNTKNNNEYFDKYIKVGDLHIYQEGKDMEYFENS